MIAHQGGGGGARRPSRATEAGETLIEIIITILLMGIIISAILVSMVNVSHVSNINKHKTQAAAYVTAVAEALKQPVPTGSTASTGNYVPCATAADYASIINGVTKPATTGWSVQIIDLEYLDGAGNFGSSCTQTPAQTTPVPTNATDKGAQRIWIQVKYTGKDAVTDSLVIVKRDQRCPLSELSYTNPDTGPC